jgi:hypothetical protein
MLKTVLFFMSLLKTALFKNDKQYNIKSKEFDMLKVSMFLFVCLTCVFNVYAVRHIYIQTQELKKLEKITVSDVALRNCLDTSLADYLDAAALDRTNDYKIVTAVKKCLRENKIN